MNKKLLLLVAGLLSSILSFSQGPRITSFTPTSGPVGTSVTITGTNFDATYSNHTVYFGPTKATITGGDATTLTVTVPAGMSAEPIRVINNTNGLVGAAYDLFTTTYACGGSITSTAFASTVAASTSASNPRGLCVADFDSDGKPDLATCGINSNSVSILLNTSTPGLTSFSEGGSGSTGQRPYNVAAGDLDGDGKIDMVVANNTSQYISICQNTSTGPGSVSFTHTATSSVGICDDVALADIDRDGKLDIIASVPGNDRISVLLNTSTVGSISFAARVDITTGNEPRYIAVGNINGDTRPDLVVCNYQDNTISVFTNSSAVGSVSLGKSDYTTGTSPVGAFIGDVDGDNIADVLVANSSSNTVSILKNNGGSLSTKVDFTAGTGTWHVSLGDFDGDGKNDVAALSYGTQRVNVFKNNSTVGSISLATKIDFNTSTSPTRIVVADLDLDGRPDIAVANQNGTSISVIRNQVNAPTITSFTPLQAAEGNTVTITGTNFTGATAVHFNGVPASSFTVVSATSITAVASTGATGTLSVTGSCGITGKAGFIHIPPLPRISSFTPESAAPGTSVTINGQHFQSTMTDNLVYFGAVPATVTAASSTSLIVTVPTGATFDHIRVTDNISKLTGYSRAFFSPAYSCATTLGSGSFDTPTNSTTGTNPYDATAFDIDGDGIADMAVANYNSNSISIFRNTTSAGSVSFATKVDITTTSKPRRVVFADLDGDGKPDMIVPYSTINQASVFRNTSTPGTISFAAKMDLTTSSTFSYPNDAAVRDLDIDGKPDLVFVAGALFVVFKNISTPGTISFQPKVDFSVPAVMSRLSIGDLDGDNKPELIGAASGSYYMSVLRNTSAYGTISFAANVNVNTGSNGAEYTQEVALGDFDADGKIDLLGVNSTNSYMYLLRNTCSVGTISFAPRVTFSTAYTAGNFTVGDVDSDGKPDIIAVYGSTRTYFSIYRNTSTSGSFSLAARQDISVSSVVDVVLADLNMDGRSDLITANYTANTLSVLLNNNISLPTPPTVTTPSYFCQNATAGPLTASGSSLLWYTSSSGGTGSSSAPVPSTVATGTTSHYVSQTIAGCESPRVQIDVTINSTIPSAPVVTSPVTNCENATAPALTATGTGLLWYALSSGGTGSGTATVPSTAAVGTIFYYVSQTVMGCEGPRAQIDVVTNSTPVSPIATSPINYCWNASASSLTATGSALLWYTLASGGSGSGTALTPSTATVGTVSYYVTQTVGGCESPRSQIDVITDAPAAPSVVTPVTYNQNATASVLTATGNSLLWYTSPSGGIGSAAAPTPSTVSVGTFNYYVSQTVSGCEGPRALIAIIVNSTTNTMDQSFKNKITLYPNPIVDEIIVHTENGLAGLVYSLLNNSGKTIQTGEIKETTTTVNISDLPDGLYLFHIQGVQGKETFRIIKGK